MESTQVLVVGAGPAGLTTACGLRQVGIDVTVIDVADAGANTSRAAIVHARTLETLDRIDVTPVLLNEGIIAPEFSVRERDRELGRLDFSGLPTSHPYAVMIPQSSTERILQARLEALGATILRRTELIALPEREGRRIAVVRDPHGCEYEFAARFVVGADGMHSRVRSESGIAFKGQDYEQSFMLADTQLRWSRPAEEAQLFLASDGIMIVAPLPGGHHRIVATVDDAPPTPAAEDFQRLLDHRGPDGAAVESVSWASRFRVSHRLADRFRSGEAFLVGDAAHVHSPAGGQGMNTGIQDGLDLADTLSAVLTGREPAESLAGYQSRRRPVAAKVIRLTDTITRGASMRGATALRLRNTVIRTALRSSRVRTAIALRIAQLK